jgi:hypothetical protein
MLCENWQDRMIKTYRPLSLLVLLFFLSAAFASKFYRGAGQVFAEAYLGDLFIVGCLYFGFGLVFTKMAVLHKARIIGLVALSVESFQATGIPASWKLPAPMSLILGTSFDPRDFVIYTLGLFIAVIVDKYYLKKKKHHADIR